MTESESLDEEHLDEFIQEGEDFLDDQHLEHKKPPEEFRLEIDTWMLAVVDYLHTHLGESSPIVKQAKEGKEMKFAGVVGNINYGSRYKSRLKKILPALKAAKRRTTSDNGEG